jgi:hypothetical protein
VFALTFEFDFVHVVRVLTVFAAILLQGRNPALALFVSALVFAFRI